MDQKYQKLEMVCFGIAVLKRASPSICVFSFSFVKVPSTLSLNIFIDGLPLSKSSPTQFWPILANIYEMPQLSPFTIAIYAGRSKPNDLDKYLKQLVSELNTLIDGGTIINQTKIAIRVRAVIADTPARSFIKGVANFNSADGCLKCTCEAEFNEDGTLLAFRTSLDANFPGILGHNK
ncbi:uncharacterized protein LOC121603288 isoform X2 [Anopheles merus]|uniref:uncharacterized protein LOC121603288 isoform X2 n=1 Tax=Anopheles merus TaxID=30066 RepID=UPI001BE3EC36|nr:uncharacterized protein LOC121603288 isoform X2 [Anopheles merus]